MVNSEMLKFILCFVIVAFVVVVFQIIMNEVGTKKEWANLQSIEDNPNVKINKEKKIQIVKFNGSEILLFKNPDTKKYLSLILNCRHEPYYKEMGSYFMYKITQDEMNYIQKNSKNMTATVVSVLGSHVNH